jgi:hypothetical protein
MIDDCFDGSCAFFSDLGLDSSFFFFSGFSFFSEVLFSVVFGFSLGFSGAGASSLSFLASSWITGGGRLETF